MTKTEHRFSKIIVGTLFALMPVGAQAAVFISEIAWMGSASSANHEWIELTNTGSAVNVDGWLLTDEKNVNITLSGTIPSQTTVVLERTSEESAPGPAFLLYTGALVNSGSDLILETASGQKIDTVSGGDDWQSVGGDNVTKETAQYTTGGWVTARATPGVYSDSFTVVEEEEEEENGDEVESVVVRERPNNNSTQTVKLVLPDVTLQLAVDAQTIGYVNQLIEFAVHPSGVGEQFVYSLDYQWNFGDGSTAVLKEPTHAFLFPGTYVVTVVGEYKRQRQVARHEITILPVELSLTKNQQGDIQVNNDSPYEIDISGYAVKGVTDFTFPPYSILLPNQTITLPRGYVATEFDPMIAVYDTQRVFLASVLPESNKSATSFASPSVSQSVVLPTQRISATFDSRQNVAPEQELVLAALEDEFKERTVPQTASVAQSLPQSERLTYVALCVLILLGILAVYLSPRRNESE